MKLVDCTRVDSKKLEGTILFFDKLKQEIADIEQDLLTVKKLKSIVVKKNDAGEFVNDKFVKSLKRKIATFEAEAGNTPNFAKLILENLDLSMN
jgi:hypothetical protein